MFMEYEKVFRAGFFLVKQYRKDAAVCERFVKYAFCDTIFREFIRKTCYNHIIVEFGEEFDKENLEMKRGYFNEKETTDGVFAGI